MRSLSSHRLLKRCCTLPIASSSKVQETPENPPAGLALTMRDKFIYHARQRQIRKVHFRPLSGSGGLSGGEPVSLLSKSIARKASPVA